MRMLGWGVAFIQVQRFVSVVVVLPVLTMNHQVLQLANPL